LKNIAEGFSRTASGVALSASLFIFCEEQKIKELQQCLHRSREQEASNFSVRIYVIC
jgi:hypothetical protein